MSLGLYVIGSNLGLLGWDRLGSILSKLGYERKGAEPSGLGHAYKGNVKFDLGKGKSTGILRINHYNLHGVNYHGWNLNVIKSFLDSA